MIYRILIIIALLIGVVGALKAGQINVSLFFILYMKLMFLDWKIDDK